jgi:hypothetical protein
MSFLNLKINIPKDEESVGSKRSYQSPVPTRTIPICPPAPRKVIDNTRRPIIKPLNFDLNINFDDFKLDSNTESDSMTPPKIKRSKND